MTESIPDGWKTCQLRDLGRWVTGGTPSRREPAHFSGGIPWVKIGDIDGMYVQRTEEQISELGLANSAARLLPRSTVCVGLYGSIGKAAILDIEAATNQAVASCIVDERVTFPAFLLFLINSIRTRLLAAGQGGTQANITNEILRSWSVALPPLHEQRRIVAKIESLTARSRAARAALADVPALLEQYRQSVLAAAFRGDLTADWRAKHPDAEPASALLARIRAERRRQWEVKYPKKKCVEPDPVDESELPELPKEWCWACADEIVEPGADIVYGIVQPGPVIPEGVPYVRGCDIQDGEILTCQLLRTSREIADRYERASLKGGDVLLGIIRATKVAVVPPELDGANITQGTARCRPSSVITTAFLAGWLDTPFAQSWLHQQYRGIDMPGLNLRDVRRLPVPLAPLAEQRQLTKVLESTFRRFRTVTETTTEALKELDRIDQSILAVAFRGELVPQDPNDEPAAALLERLKSESTLFDAGPRRRAKARAKR